MTEKKILKTHRCPAWYYWRDLQGYPWQLEPYVRQGMPLRENDHCLWSVCLYYDKSGDNGLGSCELESKISRGENPLIGAGRAFSIHFGSLADDEQKEFIRLAKRCMTFLDLINIVKLFPGTYLTQ